MANSAFLLLFALASAAPAHAALDPIGRAEDLRQVNAPALVEGAISKDAAIRARVARAYGRIQQPDGITPLEKLLGDPSADVRAEAAFALGQLAWKVPFAAGREDEITTALAAHLEDSQEVRVAVIEAIGKIGLSRAPVLLTSSLWDDHSEIVAETLLALFRYRYVLGQRNSKAPAVTLPDNLLSQVLALAHSPDAEVRKNVANEFMQIKDTRPGVTDAMIALSTDSSLWVRYFAVSALQTGADPKGAAAALHAYGDPHYEVRVAAVNALAAMGALAQLPAATVAQDSSWQVRAAYAEDVGTTKPPLAASFLDALAVDPSASVRASVLDSIIVVDKPNADNYLKKAAADSSFLIRLEAVTDALGIDENLVLQAVKPAPHPDRDVRVRSAALQTLQTYNDAQAFAAIKEGLSSKSPAINNAAASSLEGRKEPEIPELAWKNYLKWEHPQWEDLRTNLLAPLIDLKTAQTTEWLTQALTDPSDEVVQAAYAELKTRNVPNLGPEKDPPFTHSPYEDLTFQRDPIVVLETNKGAIEIQCFAKDAPIHVANFVGRAAHGLYNGKAWHRVVADFVIQGASTDGTGWGNPGYNLRAEINRKRYDRGAVGMPRADDFNSGSDQVFINHVPTPFLDGQYTVFGQVIGGLDVVDAIEVGDMITRAEVYY